MTTEREMLDRLHVWLEGVEGLHPPRYAAAEHVRSATGYDARRVADMIALDLWPSSGLKFHGFEVKVSRADWLTELRNPDKAGTFLPYVDYWWLAVSDPAIVQADLPRGWGLLAPHGPHTMQILKPARRRALVMPMPAAMNAALIRAVAATARAQAAANGPTDRTAPTAQGAVLAGSGSHD